jgi:hypothetical protein
MTAPPEAASVAEFLDSPAGIGLQLLAWGYAITGDVTETSALIAEGHSDLAGAAWDLTADRLATQVITRAGEQPRRVRDWAALPWLTEHLIRTEAPWPGL